MKKYKTKIITAIVLFSASLAIYCLHYLFFRDLHHILIYLVGDIAFLPIEVFLVSIVIESIISSREKKEKLEKLNMVIETFFSEFGKVLLLEFSRKDDHIGQIKSMVTFSTGAEKMDFKTITKQLQSYVGNIRIGNIDLKELCSSLRQKRQFLLGLLQNPNLLEHQSFTETLLAVFHLTEELAARDLTRLSETDLNHLKGDAERAYNHLIQQWVRYMEYVRKNYPFLFAFALRTNPFGTG